MFKIEIIRLVKSGKNVAKITGRTRRKSGPNCVFAKLRVLQSCETHLPISRLYRADKEPALYAVLHSAPGFREFAPLTSPPPPPSTPSSRGSMEPRVQCNFVPIACTVHCLNDAVSPHSLSLSFSAWISLWSRLYWKMVESLACSEINCDCHIILSICKLEELWFNSSKNQSIFNFLDSEQNRFVPFF